MRKLAKITALLLLAPVLTCGCGREEPEPEPVEVAPEIIHVSREPDTAEILAAVEAWYPAVTNSVIHTVQTTPPPEEATAIEATDDATANLISQIIYAAWNITDQGDGSIKSETWDGAWGIYGGDCVMMPNGDLVFYKGGETYYRLGGDGWFVEPEKTKGVAWEQFATVKGYSTVSGVTGELFSVSPNGDGTYKVTAEWDGDYPMGAVFERLKDLSGFNLENDVVPVLTLDSTAPYMKSTSNHSVLTITVSGDVDKGLEVSGATFEVETTTEISYSDDGSEVEITDEETGETVVYKNYAEVDTATCEITPKDEIPPFALSELQTAKSVREGTLEEYLKGHIIESFAFTMASAFGEPADDSEADTPDVESEVDTEDASEEDSAEEDDNAEIVICTMEKPGDLLFRLTFNSKVVPVSFLSPSEEILTQDDDRVECVVDEETKSAAFKIADAEAGEWRVVADSEAGKVASCEVLEGAGSPLAIVASAHTDELSRHVLSCMLIRMQHPALAIEQLQDTEPRHERARAVEMAIQYKTLPDDIKEEWLLAMFDEEIKEDLEGLRPEDADAYEPALLRNAIAGNLFESYVRTNYPLAYDVLWAEE